MEDDPTSGNVILKGFFYLDEDYFIQAREEELNENPNEDRILPAITVDRPRAVSFSPRSLAQDQNNNEIGLSDLTPGIKGFNTDNRANGRTSQSQDDDSNYGSVTSTSELWKRRLRPEFGHTKSDSESDFFNTPSLLPISKKNLFKVRMGLARELKKIVIDFLRGIRPIDMKIWRQKRLASRSCECLRAPIRLFLTLTTPVADLDARNTRWNKPLACFQFLAGPVFIVSVVKFICEVKIGVFPLPLVVFIVAAISVLIMIFTTSYTTQPRYYRVLAAVLGFAVSVTWIFKISNEVIATLRVRCFVAVNHTLLYRAVFPFVCLTGDRDCSGFE